MRSLPEGLTESQWADAVANTHQMCVRAAVLLEGEVVPGFDDVPVVAGTVTLDVTAARYGRLDCQIVTPDRLPATPGDAYAPIGYELRIERGIVIGGVEYFVPLGVFPIASSSIDTPGRVTSISAWDRSWRIQRAKFEEYYHVDPGVNYAEAIAALLSDRWPGVVTNFPSIDFTTPHLVFDGWSDPWAAAQRMARSCGYGLRFDGEGIVTMVADAVFTGTPVATLSTETNAVSVSHALDAEGSFNAQTVFTSNTSTTDVYSATVVDDDPESITWWDGPFGHVPADPIQSEFATTEAHCEAEAQSRIATTRGIASRVTGTASPDPRWEPADLILAEATEIGMSSPHIIESLAIGLTPDAPMNLRTRARQVTDLG